MSGFFDAEGRGLEQDGAPQCAKNVEIRLFLVFGEVPSLRSRLSPYWTQLFIFIVAFYQLLCYHCDTQKMDGGQFEARLKDR